MKLVKIIGTGFLGGFGDTLAGSVIGGKIYTGPHKYGVVVAGSGLIIGSLIGGWIGRQL